MASTTNVSTTSPTPGQHYELAYVQGDWLVGQAQAYVSDSCDTRWAQPHFTMAQALELQKALPYLHYDAGLDAFVFKTTAAVKTPVQVFAATTILLGNTPTPVYAIGAGVWCWERCLPLRETA